VETGLQVSAAQPQLTLLFLMKAAVPEEGADLLESARETCRERLLLGRTATLLVPAEPLAASMVEMELRRPQPEQTPSDVSS
jgi:hypothetical protein